jgi:HAD superfamily hydrolase (TIGR01458 family)
MRPADGCIIDLDGTLYRGGEAIQGAAEAVAAVRGTGVPICFATNTTRRPRSALVERLAGMGIEILAEELHTAPVAASGWLAEQGARRLMLLLPKATLEEFAGFELVEAEPEFVVVGDLGEGWSFEVLNRAFRALVAGAGLVAIHKNRSWDPGSGLQLDAGPFVAALEYAAGVEAVLVGKPSPPFFATAAAALGVDRSRVAVVGDAVANEVAGGHAAGCLGVAVRTGSFREMDLEALDRPPDAVLDSIADLPAWLGIEPVG